MISQRKASEDNLSEIASTHTGQQTPQDFVRHKLSALPLNQMILFH